MPPGKELLVAGSPDANPQNIFANLFGEIEEQLPPEARQSTQKSSNTAISKDEVLGRLVQAFRDEARESDYVLARAAHERREACRDLLAPPRAANDIKAIHAPHHPGKVGPVRVRHEGEWSLSAPAPVPAYVEGRREPRGGGLHYAAGGWDWTMPLRADALPHLDPPEESDAESGEEETHTQHKSASLDRADQGGVVISPLNNDVDAFFDDIGQDNDKLPSLAFDNAGYSVRTLPGHTRRPVLGKRKAHCRETVEEKRARELDRMATEWLKANDPELRRPKGTWVDEHKSLARARSKMLSRIRQDPALWTDLCAKRAKNPARQYDRNRDARAMEAFGWINEIEENPALERSRQIVWCWLRSQQSQRGFCKTKGLAKSTLRDLIGNYCGALADRVTASQQATVADIRWPEDVGTIVSGVDNIAQALNRSVASTRRLIDSGRAPIGAIDGKPVALRALLKKFRSRSTKNADHAIKRALSVAAFHTCTAKRMAESARAVRTFEGRAAFSIKEFGELLGRSRAWVHSMIKDGTIPTTNVTGSTMIPASVVIALMETDRAA